MAEEGLGSFNPANMAWTGNVGYDSGIVDRNMVCMFYMRPIHSPGKSKEAGRPFYEDKVFVRIHPAGERPLNVVDREATDMDKRRFATQWHQFQQNKMQQPEGTPIDLLYPDHPSVAAMLRANGISTVEQCANLSGNAIESMGMGSQRYVNAAKTYLEAATKGVGVTRLRAELEERDREIRVLNRKVESLMAEVENLRAGATAAPDLAQLQALLSRAMGRPQSLPAANFDAQQSMINATSATAQVTEAARNRRRPRAKLGN